MTAKFEVGKFYRDAGGQLVRIESVTGNEVYSGVRQPITGRGFGTKKHGIMDYTCEGYYGAEKGEFATNNLLTVPVIPTPEEIDSYGIDQEELSRDSPAGPVTGRDMRKQIIKTVELAVLGSLDVKDGIVQSGSDANCVIDCIINHLLANKQLFPNLE